jgi:hypothetical protein
MATMNYTYELKQEMTTIGNEMIFFVYESKNGIRSVSSVNEILFSLNRKEFKNSQLERMYMWLQANHPELLL